MASLSVEDLGQGRFKIRWRELVAGPDGSATRGSDGRFVRRARSVTVEGKDARDEAVAKIRRALVDEGAYEAPAVVVPAVANLELAAAAWVAWKRTRCTASSARLYAQHMGRLFGGIRVAKGLAATEVVLASVLSRDLLVQVVQGLQTEGLSESFVYSCARSALEMWRWVSDDSEQWPGVPTPPREGKVVLPRPPLYVAPPAPTLAEADACLRYLPVDAVQSWRIGTFLRFTGLRIRQVTGIRRRDLDLDDRTLTVTEGKSRAEKATQRTVPVARALIAEVRGWVEALPEDALLFPAWGIVGSERRAGIRPDVFRAAWEEATRWGEAREIAWKPATRLVARPEHAFRSAFQAALRAGGVQEQVIDAMVGHHGHSTRDRHYAGHDTLLARMRDAVDDLPAIDWRGPLRMKRREAG